MKLTKLITILILALSTIVHADVVKVSGFKALPQEKSNWCWAASIQSVFLTKGLNVTQTQIVSAAYGSPLNKTAPGFGGTLKILNGLSVSADGSVWEVSAFAGNSFPNANWLYKELADNKPVMIWFKDQTTNHSIIVNGGRYFKDNVGGIQWQEIYAYDPWFKQNMVIHAANIPKYVYGSFDVKLKKTDAQAPSSQHISQQTQLGGICKTPIVACYLAQRLPLGSQCFCPKDQGVVYGSVSN